MSCLMYAQAVTMAGSYLSSSNGQENLVLNEQHQLGSKCHPVSSATL